MAYASDIKQYIKCHKCHIVMIRSFFWGKGGGRKSCLRKTNDEAKKTIFRLLSQERPQLSAF